jgi:predicted transcriptional regulator
MRDTVEHMAEPKKHYREDPAPILDEEDEETLAAIDEGIRDADAGRTVPIEEVRKRMHGWNTGSS